MEDDDYHGIDYCPICWRFDCIFIPDINILGLDDDYVEDEITMNINDEHFKGISKLAFERIKNLTTSEKEQEKLLEFVSSFIVHLLQDMLLAEISKLDPNKVI